MNGSNIDNPYFVFTTASSVGASRAIDGTVYQNTSGKPKLVVVTVQQKVANGTQIDMHSDSANPPTTTIARIQGNAAVIWNTYGVVGLVLPNHYYKVTESVAGQFDLILWIEYE